MERQNLVEVSWVWMEWLVELVWQVVMELQDLVDWGLRERLVLME